MSEKVNTSTRPGWKLRLLGTGMMTPLESRSPTSSKKTCGKAGAGPAGGLGSMLSVVVFFTKHGEAGGQEEWAHAHCMVAWCMAGVGGQAGRLAG
jgi:hypothetical protein